jgi:hypothetical protein
MIMSKWKPIETAPRDGTTILVYGYWEGEISGKEKKPNVWLCSSQGVEDEFCLEGCDGYAAWVNNPMYWMPLPPPPTESM